MVGRLPAVGPSLKAAVLCFAAASILVSLAGCGSSSSTTAPAQTAPAASTITTGLAPAADCVPAPTDGHGGPYPAAVSSECSRRKTVEVDIVNDPKTVGGFSPSNVTVSPGTVVDFVWKSSGHNLSPFHDQIEDTGYVYRRTFNRAGEYDYSCQIHSGQN